MLISPIMETVLINNSYECGRWAPHSGGSKQGCGASGLHPETPASQPGGTSHLPLPARGGGAHAHQPLPTSGRPRPGAPLPSPPMQGATVPGDKRQQRPQVPSWTWDLGAEASGAPHDPSGGNQRRPALPQAHPKGRLSSLEGRHREEGVPPPGPFCGVTWTSGSPGGSLCQERQLGRPGVGCRRGQGPVQRTSSLTI